MATKILLVDDDALVLDYLSQLVGAAGFTVGTASSAEAALVSMEADFAPIVLIDIGLPGMDGLALCRAIRSRMYGGRVYVLLHTARDTDADILEGFNAGADDYLIKGTSRAQVIGRLRTAQSIVALEQNARTPLEGAAAVLIPGIDIAAFG
jgi:DNA-binding response OmpR family regulator